MSGAEARRGTPCPAIDTGPGENESLSIQPTPPHTGGLAFQYLEGKASRARVMSLCASSAATQPFLGACCAVDATGQMSVRVATRWPPTARCQLPISYAIGMPHSRDLCNLSSFFRLPLFAMWCWISPPDSRHSRPLFLNSSFGVYRIQPAPCIWCCC